MDIVIFTCLSGIFFQRAMGAYQIAHFLRSHGYTVQVIDFTDNFTDDELLEVSKKFITSDTIAIGLSTTFYTVNEVNSKFIHNDRNKFEFLEFPTNVLSVIEKTKEIYPNIKVVIGGAKSEAGKNLPNIDAVIHGYAEDKFLEYLNSLPNNKKRIKKSVFSLTNEQSKSYVEVQDDPIVKEFSIENLDHRFLPNDVILRNETLPLEISRGCIFKCSFCAFPLNGKSKLDYIRDSNQIKDELIYNYENYGTTNYYLSDDTFNDSTEKVQRIHSVITSLPFKIQFTTYLRLDLLYAHKEQIPLMKEMGLVSPFFGIESLNQKSATSIGKGMNTTRAKDFLLELYYDYWKEEIPITCSFIVGLPYETKETINDTYTWVKNSPINSVFFPLALTNKTYYKSEFNTNYEKYGYKLDLDTGYWENEHFNYTEANTLAEQYNEELLRKENYPSSWFLMTLLNHGYTLDDLRKTKTKDLSFNKILRNRQKNIKEYKEKLQGINIQKE
jgi:radical SAM superfamily enzyme YgiQ (UPF0313 family)